MQTAAFSYEPQLSPRAAVLLVELGAFAFAIALVVLLLRISDPRDLSAVLFPVYLLLYACAMLWHGSVELSGKTVLTVSE